MNWARTCALPLSLWVCILLVACSQSEEIVEIPKHILRPDKLQGVLYDAQILESQLELIRMPEDAILDSSTAFYNHLYQKHGISSDQFDTTIKYYTLNEPGLLMALYDSVIKRLKIELLEYVDVESHMNFQLNHNHFIKALTESGIAEVLSKPETDLKIFKSLTMKYFEEHKKELLHHNMTPTDMKYSMDHFLRNQDQLFQVKRSIKRTLIKRK